MDNKSDEHFIIMKSAIEANKQKCDEEIMNIIKDIKEILAPSITFLLVGFNCGFHDDEMFI